MRLSSKSHNLHLRAALARGDAAAALRHFEAMSAAHPPQVLEPAAPAPAPSSGSAAATPAAAAPPVEGALSGSEASEAWWLGEPARPDAHSYSIALTALRAAAPSDAPQAEHVERARRAAALARAAMARGGGSGGGAGGRLSAPLVHSLITSCGGDVQTALALWRMPMVSGGAGAGAGAGAEAEAEAEARRAGLHALLRVCGVGGRADQALRVVTAARRQGNAPDASFWTAYVNGRAEADQGAVVAGVGAYRQLLQSGYERLLRVECCPEQVGGKLGKVERIRIRF